jgi:DNA-binding response OmpR family regulator
MLTKRILLIEDEDGLREILKFSLEAAAGWKVFSAASGSAGIEIAQDCQPDAILLDVMMPEMDGIETFRSLQTHALTRQIPTIFLTAKARSHEQRQFLDLGVAGVITKPTKPQDLVDQIRTILHW